MGKVKLVDGKLPKGRECLIRLSDLGVTNSNVSNRWSVYYYEFKTVWFCHYDGTAWYEVWSKANIKKVGLNDYFRNWKNPTKNEVAYFKMITGLPYLTDYLKIEPLDD